MATFSVGPPDILSPAQIAFVAQGAGFTGDNLVIAVAVAMAESGGNAKAHNAIPPDDSYGLWQINMYSTLGTERFKKYGHVIKTKEDLYNPWKNVQIAKDLHQSSGWSPWSTYKNGKFRNHLDEARAGVSKPEEYKPGGNTGTGADGSSPSNILERFAEFIFGLLKPVILRTAGFVGGGVLVILAIVLYVRSQSR